MGKKNELLYEKAIEAINALHDDTSVSIEQTASQLRAVREELDVLIEAVLDDIDENE